MQLVAEISDSADSLFGLGPTQTTVLDQTFNTVDIYGDMLTVGNFVASSSISAVDVSETTYTYTPYVEVVNLAGDPSNDLVYGGTPYQEVLTNFPLGSQVLEGLFLNVTTESAENSAGQRQLDTVQKTIFDRNSITAQQAGFTSTVSVSPDSGPALSQFDTVTLAVTPGDQLASADDVGEDWLAQLASEDNAIVPGITSNDPNTADQAAEQAISPVSDTLVQTAALIDGQFLIQSDENYQALAQQLLTTAYVASPPIVASRPRSPREQLPERGTFPSNSTSSATR